MLFSLGQQKAAGPEDVSSGSGGRLLKAKGHRSGGRLHPGRRLVFAFLGVVQVLEPVCLGGAWCSPRASDRCQVHRTGRLFAGRRPKAAAHRVAGGRLCSRTRVGLYFVLCSLNLCCLLCVCRRLPAGPALALRPSGPEACGSSSLGRGGTPANR